VIGTRIQRILPGASEMATYGFISIPSFARISLNTTAIASMISLS
jgi:hypothetical protein